jgi:hypothetical protein
LKFIWYEALIIVAVIFLLGYKPTSISLPILGGASVTFDKELAETDVEATQPGTTYNRTVSVLNNGPGYQQYNDNRTYRGQFNTDSDRPSAGVTDMSGTGTFVGTNSHHNNSPGFMQYNDARKGESNSS